MIKIKTYHTDNEKAECLICNTVYTNGKHIYPLPKCKCGNISFFDISEIQVRIGVQWPYVHIGSKKDWKNTILNEITENGKPKRYFER